MFGDFFQNFGLNFPHLGADRAGGLFGGTFNPEQAMQNVLRQPGDQQGRTPEGMPGPGGGAGAPQMPGGRLAEGQAPGVSPIARPPPTAAGVAQPPMAMGGSPLGPGGGSPLGPGQDPQAPSDRLAPGGELAELLRKFEPGGMRAQ
jgi:hypothetical protein